MSQPNELTMFERLKVRAIDLVGIYTGFIYNYAKLGIRKNSTDDFCTLKEINYFSEIGSMLGYLPTTEDSRTETKRPMDLAWWQILEDGKDHKLILHMERENNPDKAEETIDKLLPKILLKDITCVAEYVIGIQRLRVAIQVISIKTKIEKQAQNEKGLFIFYYVDEKKREIAEGFLLENGALAQLDTATFYDDEVGFWRATFNNKYI